MFYLFDFAVNYDEPTDPTYLGIAKENALWLSKLLLYWVNPLIKKGRYGKIQSPDDVFDLPPDMSAAAASETFATYISPGYFVLAKKPYFILLLSLFHIVYDQQCNKFIYDQISWHSGHNFGRNVHFFVPESIYDR